ncbi:hypothetical protein PC116_g23802 [Phytophthora cactorum]|uniref:Uncharacterized protein n=1 Tax=Phytophthora cactorum TaxID=29920 RepID=A0A8T1BJ82_9STRA|nr:hypothetical protein Pcac1_g19557 [Phytophthora cactorum]KAG2881490.1 hypothetical protein PC114_g21530 [Phytophthora cactorum]KAG2902989.1 hypothetical protein PC117_g21358 [Phytophthora cactorum]KAG4227825.1 hypothetical protein PC116_g23802 [Phytophthora cactorum]
MTWRRQRDAKVIQPVHIERSEACRGMHGIVQRELNEWEHLAPVVVLEIPREL